MNWPDWHVVSTDDTDGYHSIRFERDDLYATVSLSLDGDQSPSEFHDLVAQHLADVVDDLARARAGIPGVGRAYHLRGHAHGPLCRATRIDRAARTVDLTGDGDTQTVTLSDFAREWVAVGLESVVWPDWVPVINPLA